MARVGFEELEAIAEGGLDRAPVEFTKIRDAEGIRVVRFRTSPLEALARGSNPISDAAYEAGKRLTADFDAGLMGTSNTGAICDTLAQTVQATPGELKAKAEGKLMRSAGEWRVPKDRVPRQIEIAERIVAVQRRLSSTDWFLVEQLLRYELTPSRIATMLGVSPHWAILAVRIALCHLAAAYTDIDRPKKKFVDRH